MHNYSDITRELEEKASVPYGDIFVYEGTPLEDYFERLFNFYQENLTNYCKEYDIQPAKVFFQNEFGVNAYAGVQQNYFIIKINADTVVTLQRLFYEQNFLFDLQNAIAVKYLPLKNILTALQMHPAFVMFQAATQFTYYHELGHLIQKSEHLKSFLGERNISDLQTAYSLIHHLLEFDSDLFAAHNLLFHIIDYWRKFPEEHRTDEQLHCLLSLSAGAIFLYFMELESHYKEIYYQNGTHPHPVVRITYIMDCFIQAAKLNLQKEVEIQPGIILNDSFTLAEEFSKIRGQDSSVERYRTLFIQEHESIGDYIAFLIEESENIEYLVKNKYY